MELQFDKTVCPCLRKVVAQVQTQEQTQELRLPDAMPDIGRVLGCWGQILIRGKEWRGNGMSVSGGVMAWVLYAPEDGSEPRVMDSWIPFQMKWDFPETRRDGRICVLPLLKCVDGRSVSARKLMLRAVVSVLGEALEPVETEIFAPQQLPEDVEILRQTYPMELPMEAGEKAFQLEEENTLPDAMPGIARIIHYEVAPRITEQKIMADRLVFRGVAAVHLLYSAEDGTLHNWDGELPFSQYTDLDRDYGSGATAWVTPVLTGMEMEKGEDGKLQVKFGLTAQYVIYDRKMIDVVEDAYSPMRQIRLQQQELKLPVRLDQQTDTISVTQTARTEEAKVLDVSAFWDQPICRQSADMVELEVPVQFQTLYLDENGAVQTSVSKTEGKYQIPSDRGNTLDVYLQNAGQPGADAGAEGIDLRGSVTITAAIATEQGIPMVTGLELGEAKEPDPGRPSLILRRAEDCRLWDLAKECGSTVSAIQKANQLQQEPDANQVLLIPVL